MDIVVSSGEGKTKESELRTSVYKRALERTYNLKTKHGRQFFSEVLDKYPTLCFSLRSFEDEITTKLAVSECSKHDLLIPYPVLMEKAGEVVASFKMTVAILPGGTTAITGLNFDTSKLVSDKKLHEEIEKLISQSMDKNSQRT